MPIDGLHKPDEEVDGRTPRESISHACQSWNSASLFASGCVRPGPRSS